MTMQKKKKIQPENYFIVNFITSSFRSMFKLLLTFAQSGLAFYLLSFSFLVSLTLVILNFYFM
jgi:HKD family nuclease